VTDWDELTFGSS